MNLRLASYFLRVLALGFVFACVPALVKIEMETHPRNKISSYELEFNDLRRFCAETPSYVLCRGSAGGRLSIRRVIEIDQRLRARFQYRSDFDVWGVSDRWTGFAYEGDCEDYVLTLSEMLAGEGEGGKYMSMSLLLVPDALSGHMLNGHATLLVETSDFGVVEIGVRDSERPASLTDEGRYRLVAITMDGLAIPRAYRDYKINYVSYTVRANILL